MNTVVLFVILTIYVVSGYHNKIPKLSRHKRGTFGALEIITNHAKLIHADVKKDNNITEKPCPNTYLEKLPSNIESGVVFKVVPTQDIYVRRSLRRSSPLSTKLDLIRAISRMVTIIALLVSAVLEFYPVVQNLYNIVYQMVE